MTKIDRRTRRKNNVNLTLEEVMELDIPLSTHKRFNNLLGRTFGKLKVIKYYGIKNTTSHWYCLCECGTINISSGTNLLINHSTSCGCVSEANFGVTTHGETDTIEYRSWYGLKDRCSKTSGRDYWRYKAKGITYCERWDKYENFKEDMGECPKIDGVRISLDRIDNSKGYYKENCKWSTTKEQANNRDTNVVFTIGDVSHTITGWSELYNKNPNLVITRVNSGWSIEKALNEPTRVYKTLEFNGECLTFKEWSVRVELEPSTIRNRIKLGWTIEEALKIPVDMRRETYYAKSNDINNSAISEEQQEIINT